LQQPTPNTDLNGAFKRFIGPAATDAQATDLINKVVGNFSLEKTATP
jgi:hypothetical protein